MGFRQRQVLRGLIGSDSSFPWSSSSKVKCSEEAARQWKSQNLMLHKDKKNGHAYLRCIIGDYNVRYKISCIPEECKDDRIMPQYPGQNGWCLVQKKCGMLQGKCAPTDVLPKCKPPMQDVLGIPSSGSMQDMLGPPPKNTIKNVGQNNAVNPATGSGQTQNPSEPDLQTKTPESGTQKPPKPESCPSKCSECAGVSSPGGMPLVGGKCTQYCSKDFCGYSAAYRTADAVDCRGCSNFTCRADCNVCTDTACIQCMTDLYLYQGKCHLKCFAGHYPSGSTCEPCKEGCAKCVTRNICNECNQGKYLHNTQCLSECPQDYAPRGGVCQKETLPTVTDETDETTSSSSSSSEIVDDLPPDNPSLGQTVSVDVSDEFDDDDAPINHDQNPGNAQEFNEPTLDNEVGDEGAGDGAGTKLRLVGAGATELKGRLEVFRNGVWGTVCDDGFGEEGAQVACKHLGFESEGAELADIYEYGYGDDEIWLTDVYCTGQEETLTSCPHKWGNTDGECGHDEDVALKCRRPIPKDCDETLSGEKDYLYRGCQTQTRSGRTCQDWSEHEPKLDDPEAGIGEHNFCRNPKVQWIGAQTSQRGDTIWCFTTDPNVKWDYCVPVGMEADVDHAAHSLATNQGGHQMSEEDMAELLAASGVAGYTEPIEMDKMPAPEGSFKLKVEVKNSYGHKIAGAIVSSLNTDATKLIDKAEPTGDNGMATVTAPPVGAIKVTCPGCTENIRDFSVEDNCNGNTVSCTFLMTMNIQVQ